MYVVMSTEVRKKMPYKNKEDRASYMREYRRKKKLEQEQISLREKNRIADLNFKRLIGKITNAEYMELLKLEQKHFPAEVDYERDPWGDLFITPEIKTEAERERAERERAGRDPPPLPLTSPDFEEFLSPLRYGRDTPGKTVYVGLDGEPIEKPKRNKTAWSNFWGEEP